MKGLELPINVLVIVAIAVIVLLGIVALYLGGWTPFGSSIGVESVKNEACAELVRKGCNIATSSINIPNFDADQDGLSGYNSYGIAQDIGSDTIGSCGSSATGDLDDNLYNLCECYYGRTSEVECKRLCGCI
jgi:hypothetical protein